MDLNGMNLLVYVTFFGLDRPLDEVSMIVVY